MVTNNLRDSQILKAILDTAVDGIIIIDANGIIQSINAAGAILFNYKTDELIGQNVHVLMASPHKDHHDEYIKSYIKTGKGKIIGIGREVEGRRKNGEMFPFWLSVSEVPLNDGILFTGVVHDITELKKAENRLKELNEKLEKRVEERTNKIAEVVNKLLETNKTLEIEISERKKAESSLKKSQKELKASLEAEKELNELKSRFVTLASHEFRTPLSNILSSASLIEKYTAEDMADKRERHTEKIKASVRNLNNILNDFLSLSKIEEGKIAYRQEEFDVVNLLKQEIDYMEDGLKKDQYVDFQSDVEKLIVKLDKSLLKNIFINLLSNASKYSAEGKSISCHIESNKNSFKLTVTDQGIGIPDKDKNHMFDRFFRASNSTNIQGTGLGLNIVKSYAEMMQGEVNFTSDVDKGSSFFVILPIEHSPDE